MRLTDRRMVLLVLALVATTAWADWRQFRGSNGDGISTEKMLESWPETGPKVLWKMNVGAGLGAPVIRGDKAYFLAQEDSNETCFAIELRTGKAIWSTPLGPTQSRRSAGQGGPGPSSTPAIEGDKVYTYGSMLKLACLNAADGKIVWEHDVQSEFNGQAQSSGAIRAWGSACSPVVEGDLVIVPGGGDGQAFLAFNKTSGEVAWKKETEILTHATPAVATIAGVRQVIFFTQFGLVSVAPQTGEVLWKQAYQSATAIGASPVVSGDIVYCSIGYGIGGGAFQIAKEADTFSVKQLWRTKGQAMNQWSTPVIKDGYVYLIHGTGNDKKAALQCIELATGKLMWTGPAVGQGEILMADGKLIIQTATGRLLLVDPGPQSYKEISSTQPLTGQAWGWPAFGNGVFIYRTNKEAAAIDLSAP